MNMCESHSATFERSNIRPPFASRRVNGNVRRKLQCNLERRTDLISKCSQVKRNADVLVVVVSYFSTAMMKMLGRLRSIIIHRFITNKSQRLLFASEARSALTYLHSIQLAHAAIVYTHAICSKSLCQLPLDCLCSALRMSFKIPTDNSHALLHRIPIYPCNHPCSVCTGSAFARHSLTHSAQVVRVQIPFTNHDHDNRFLRTVT